MVGPSKAQVAGQPHQELGILNGGAWKQWVDGIGENYYEDLSTGTIQHRVPAGLEDSPSDGWTEDKSKPWPQWINDRTGRIKRWNPHPKTYLESLIFQAYIQDLKRSVDPGDNKYRRVMKTVMSFSFDREFASSSNSSFMVVQHEPRGVGGEMVDIIVLQLCQPPNGEASFYDFCLVESRSGKADWIETHDRFSKKCANTHNPSGNTYAILHIGYQIQIFFSTKGILEPLSERLHIVDDVDAIAAQLAAMRARPFSFVD